MLAAPSATAPAPRDECRSLIGDHVAPVEWDVAASVVPYPQAIAEMDRHVAAMLAESAGERVWLVEHPPLYTAGTSAKAGDLVDGRFPVFRSGRGGQYTYHGPGQRVAYVMLDLRHRGRDVRCFVSALEGWIIDTLAEFGLRGERRSDRIGVWMAAGGGRPEAKIAAIGVRVRHSITLHGLSINVRPDLSHYEGIVPCGVTDYGVTSLADLGVDASMTEVDEALARTFPQRFGPLAIPA